MTYIPPLAYALPQAIVTQEEPSTEKTRQARRVSVTPQSTDPQADQFDHQVESPEQASPIHEEARQRRQPGERHPHHHDDESTEEGGEPDHIDLTA